MKSRSTCRIMNPNTSILVLITGLMLLIFSLLIFSGCETHLVEPDSSITDLPRELSPTELMIIEAGDEFSYDLFRRTVSHDRESENIFISPLSISMALAMTLNGADGETYHEMRESLYLNQMSREEINEAFESLITLLTDLDPAVTLNIANSIWHEETLPVREEFLERLETYFNATSEGLDFGDPQSVDIINQWVHDHTEGLIEEIIEGIPRDVVMYLINAIYFNGEWHKQFDPDETYTTDFYLENGETSQIEMMRRDGSYATYSSEDVDMVEIPYGDSLYSMSVLMPGDPDQPLDTFIDETLTAENLNSWRNNLQASEQRFGLHFPKFELEYKIEYKEILSAMGMERAFTAESADLSRIADVGQYDLFLNQVFHKARVMVDEEGTEAAAATAVEVGIVSAPPQFVVDRPFVFIIHERKSGTNLFMGKIKSL